MYNSYFYLIQNQYNGKLYAGCKYASNTDPHTFLTLFGYQTSSKIIHRLIQEHGIGIFKITTLIIFEAKEAAYEYETYYLQMVNAAQNDIYYNQHNNMLSTIIDATVIADRGAAISNTMSDPTWKETVGKQSILKRQQTCSDPTWKETVGERRSQRQSDIQHDLEWKRTTGAAGIEKRLATTDYVSAGKTQSVTKNSIEWKQHKGAEGKAKEMKTKTTPGWIETVGKQAKIKNATTRASYEWQATIGACSNQQIAATKANPEWIATVGKQSASKQSDTKRSAVWKEQNYKTCIYCGKYASAAMISRWHNAQCKSH